VFKAGHEVGARWLRIIIVPSDPRAASKIRAAHAAGFSIVLTIGGTGTTTPRPSALTLLRTIRRLPRVERYTVINEPDLLNLTACEYRKRWSAVRRVVGRRLLWGDFSPYHPVAMTLRARRCGVLPAKLDVAIHPYQSSDPLARGADEGGIGNLSRSARLMGGKVTWWLDEFAYEYERFKVTDEQAASMWPRAILVAQRLHARMLSIYMAQGPTWDSRPRERSWCVLTHVCPAPARLLDGPFMPFEGV
jgi:hypothetical protein